MTYALLIRTADGASRVAGPGTSFSEWHERARHMCYAHPSVARTSWRAFRKKFPDVVVSGHIVPFRELPGVLSGRLPLPEAL
jgi:hypothetical protein